MLHDPLKIPMKWILWFITVELTEGHYKDPTGATAGATDGKGTAGYADGAVAIEIFECDL